MTIAQVSGPISKRLPPRLILTDLPDLPDLLEMGSSQGGLLDLKSPQEMMQMFSGIVSKSKHIFDCQHVRLQQGGIEVNLLMMSSLFDEPSLEELNGSVNESDFASSTHIPPLSVAEAQRCHQLIQKEMNSIFQYKRFQNDTVMANSLLHTLKVVQDATDAWMRKRRVLALSKHDKARVLREFLSRCIIQELSPDPGNPPPRNLPQVVSPSLRKQWIEYLILLWQHVDGKTRQRVVKILDSKTNILLGNGTYSRRTQAGRERLAAVMRHASVSIGKKKCRRNNCPPLRLTERALGSATTGHDHRFGQSFNKPAPSPPLTPPPILGGELETAPVLGGIGAQFKVPPLVLGGVRGGLVAETMTKAGNLIKFIFRINKPDSSFLRMTDGEVIFLSFVNSPARRMY